MRLIDADALYKKAAEWESLAMEALKKPSLNVSAEGLRWQTILGERTAFKHDIADAPTIDAVPVVRCKDCREYNVKKGVCGYANYYPSPDDYCSRAVRWEEDG